MIKINLLPPNERTPERAPMGPILIRMSGLAVAGVVGLIDVFLWLNNVSIENENANLEENIKQLSKQVQQHTDLMTVKTQLEARRDDIRKITTRPILWTEAVDQIWEVIHRNPRIWVDGIKGLDVKAMASELRQIGVDPKEIAKYTAAVGMACNAASEDTGFITKFRMDLRTREQLQRIFNDGIDRYPEWQLKEQEDAEEKVSNAFRVVLLAKDLSAAPAAGAPGAAAPPPKPK